MVVVLVFRYSLEMKIEGVNMEKKPKSVIKREEYPKNFRDSNEVSAAYKQVGNTPNRSTKSWYRDIYEFYQNNEV